MKAAILFTSSGPIVVLTRCESLKDPVFIQKLSEKGVDRFIGFELPLDKVRERYGNHYNVSLEDLKETDELHVLDFNGTRAMGLFDFSEYGEPVYSIVPYHEPIGV
jgi:hypothetical protein